MEQLLKQLRASNVTQMIHDKPYPAFSPARLELSQSGKTVLITGGGGTLGLATARAFVRAKAKIVILVGRRAAVLDAAICELQHEANAVGTQLIAETCDMGNIDSIEALWEKLKKDGISLDVFVNNATSTSDETPLLDLGAEQVWFHVDNNAKGPLFFADKFCKQSTAGQKYIVNITSAVIHGTEAPEVYKRAPYVLSKTTAALYFQLLSQQVKSTDVQIVTLEPGLLYNENWKSIGCPPDWFNDPMLPASAIVWLSSKEAEFMHGRMMWASWDVEELRTGEVRKKLDEDHYFLRVTVGGLKGGNLA